MFDLESLMDLIRDRHPEFNSGSHLTNTGLLDVIPDQVRQDDHMFDNYS